jgi:hypothetical protein
MQLRLWIQIGAVILAVVLGVAIVDAWRADRRDRTQLASELAATKKALADAPGQPGYDTKAFLRVIDARREAGALNGREVLPHG